MKDISPIAPKTVSFVNVGNIAGTYLLLAYTRILPGSLWLFALLSVSFL